MEQNLDRLAGGQACCDSGVVIGDADLGDRDGGRDGDRRGFVGALHLGDGHRSGR